MAAVAVARVGTALLSSDVRRLALGAIGALFLGSATIVFVIVMLLKSLLGFAGGSTSLGLLPGTGGAPGPLASAIVADQLAFMQQVAAASSCGLPWSVLAGVAFVESDFGTNLGAVVRGRLWLRPVHAWHLAELQRRRALAHERSGATRLTTV